MKTIKTSLTLSQAMNYQLLEITLFKTPIIYPSLRATFIQNLDFLAQFFVYLKRLERIFLKSIYIIFIIYINFH